MINRTHLLRGAALAFLAGTGLGAQSLSPWDAGLSLVVPFDSLKMITNARTPGGIVLEAGYNTKVHNTNLPLRLSLSVNDLPGKQAGAVEQSLVGYQAAADVIAPTGLDKLDMVAGASLNAWRLDYQDSTHQADGAVKGLKMGARFGFDYRVNPHWTASLLLQIVELGADAQSTKGYNPSWLQAGAKLRF